MAGVAVAHHRLIRQREQLLELGQRLEPLARGIETQRMVEVDGIRQPAGALGLRAFLTSLEVAGGTCVEQNGIAMFDCMLDRSEIGPQIGNKRNRIWRGW